jgi:hypothetical protein
MASPTKPSRLKTLLSSSPQKEEHTSPKSAASLAWKVITGVDQPRQRATSAEWEARWGRPAKSKTGDASKAPLADKPGFQVKEGKVKAQARALEERERSFSAVPYHNVRRGGEPSHKEHDKSLPQVPESSFADSAPSLAALFTTTTSPQPVSFNSPNSTFAAVAQPVAYSPGKENYVPADSSSTVPASAFQQRSPSRRTAASAERDAAGGYEKLGDYTPRTAAIAAAKAGFFVARYATS